MKTIRELNEKWYWRFLKVIYSFFVILAIIWTFVLPIWSIFSNSGDPISFLSNSFEIKYERNWEIYTKENLELNYYKAIPFCILMIIVSWMVYFWILYVIRWTVYYIILWDFNPKK